MDSQSLKRSLTHILLPFVCFCASLALLLAEWRKLKIWVKCLSETLNFELGTPGGGDLQTPAWSWAPVPEKCFQKDTHFKIFWSVLFNCHFLEALAALSATVTGTGIQLEIQLLFCLGTSSFRKLAQGITSQIFPRKPRFQ